MSYRALFVNQMGDDDLARGEIDNPHVCIYADLRCLTCALIRVAGDEFRWEAIELAARITALPDGFKSLCGSCPACQGVPGFEGRYCHEFETEPA